MATEEDLSDFDIHRIMEALATRQSKVVASCTLSIKLLLTEIQQQLLDLMIEERLAENPISNSGDDISYEDRIDTPDLLPQDESPMDQMTMPETNVESDDSTGMQDTVATVASVPITGALIKSPNPYPCIDCQLVFSTKKALSRHLAKHDKEDDTTDAAEVAENTNMPAVTEDVTPVPAPSANSELQDSLLAQDSRSATNGREPLRVKLEFTRSSPSKPDLSDLRVTCEECGTKTLKYHMSRHMLMHTGVKPFACTKCDSKFKRKDKLKEHMKKHEEGGDSQTKGAKRVAKSKLSKCRKCDFETEDKLLFKEHRKTHPTKMLYTCVDCGKEFHCPSHLEQHRIKHRNEKPFMCDMCGVSFSREPNLARHIRSHTSPAPYHCKFCNKPYHRNNELVVHERTHTGEKPYICEVCGNGYASSKYLKRHLFTHTGLKPFKCDLCERAFARPENMRAHRKLHEKASNRLSTTNDTVASAFRASQIDSAMADPTVDDGNSSKHGAQDMYPFGNDISLPSSIPNDPDPTANSSNNESILQSFKIPDHL